MNVSIKTSVYAEIAADIIGKISKGFFKGDNRLPSRKELCIKYGVSDMTAWKVHNELERLGMAYRVKGKGVFACQEAGKTVRKSNVPLNSVRKIVFFNYSSSIKKTEFCENKIFQGFQKRAFELGLSIRTELFSADTRGSFKITEEEGLVIPYNAGCEWLMPMMEHKRVRSVMINNYFSEAHSVINDNYSGISQLIDCLEAQKCRSFLLATRHFNSLGMANLNERTYAFKNECAKRGLKHTVMTNGNYNELLKLIKNRQAPDAVMFTTDAPAAKFKDMLLQEKISKKTLVTGFDGLSAEDGLEIENLTTVKVDYEGMGAAAVDLMLSNTLEDWQLPDIVRIPCKLLIKP